MQSCCVFVKYARTLKSIMRPPLLFIEILKPSRKLRTFLKAVTLTMTKDRRVCTHYKIIICNSRYVCVCASRIACFKYFITLNINILLLTYVRYHILMNNTKLVLIILHHARKKEREIFFL